MPGLTSSGSSLRPAMGRPRPTAQPLAGTLSTEASKICPIEASSCAWNCSSVCWSDSPSSSAREKLAIMLGSRASSAHALSRLQRVAEQRLRFVLARAVDAYLGLQDRDEPGGRDPRGVLELLIGYRGHPVLVGIVDHRPH